MAIERKTYPEYSKLTCDAIGCDDYIELQEKFTIIEELAWSLEWHYQKNFRWYCPECSGKRKAK